MSVYAHRKWHLVVTSEDERIFHIYHDKVPKPQRYSRLGRMREQSKVTMIHGRLAASFYETSEEGQHALGPFDVTRTDGQEYLLPLQWSLVRSHSMLFEAKVRAEGNNWLRKENFESYTVAAGQLHYLDPLSPLVIAEVEVAYWDTSVIPVMLMPRGKEPDKEFDGCVPDKRAMALLYYAAYELRRTWEDPSYKYEGTVPYPIQVAKILGKEMELLNE